MKFLVLCAVAIAVAIAFGNVTANPLAGLDRLVDSFGGVVNATDDLLNNTISQVQEVQSLVTDDIVSLRPALNGLGNVLGDVKPLDDAVDGVEYALDSALDGVLETVSNGSDLDYIDDLLRNLDELITGVPRAVGNLIQAALATVKKNIVNRRLTATIKDALSTLLSTVASVVEIAENVLSEINEVLNSVGLSGAFQTVRNILRKVVEDVNKIVRQISKGLGGNIIKAVEQIIENVNRVLD